MPVTPDSSGFKLYIHPLVLLLLLTAENLTLQASDTQSVIKYFRSDAGVALSGPLPDNLDTPELLKWRVTLDSGHSTPILHAGKMFLTTWRPESKELATVALDEQSGRVLWRAPLKPDHIEETHPIGSPATGTVACDGKRVFAFFGSAGVFCYDLAGGKIWEQRLGPFRDEYGAGSSPIVFDGKLFLDQDHDTDSFVIALDSATGRVLWKSARPDAVRSYSTPVIWMHNGQPELLVAGALQLTAYNPADGQRLWWLNGLARIVIPTPVIDGPMIYMASWSPGGDTAKRLELDPWTVALEKWDKNKDGKLAKNEIDNREVVERFNRMDLNEDGLLNQGEWERHSRYFKQAQNSILAIKPVGRGELPESAVVWKYPRGVPYVATPVLHRGIIWMVKEGGIVTKLDAATGRLLQEERVPGMGNYFASPVTGDNKLYFASELGTVSIVNAGQDWQVISSRDFHEKIYATPVLDRGRIFIRTQQALYCFHGTRP
jgi:outer membrane protein assembly factor BamB